MIHLDPVHAALERMARSVYRACSAARPDGGFDADYIDGIHRLAKSINPAIFLSIHFCPTRRPYDMERHHLIGVSASSDRLMLSLNLHGFEASPTTHASLIRFLGTLVLLSALTLRRDRARADFEISMADEPIGADVAFSAASEVVLVPDCEFLLSLGYRHTRALSRQNWLPWRERRNVVLWRGATTGIPRRTIAPAERRWYKVLPRTELCHRLQNSALGERCDVGISAIVQIEDRTLREMIARNLTRPFVPRQGQLRNRFTIDIDGNTNSWSGPFQAMLIGACLLRVESEHGFRQWHHRELRAWEHFVPIRSDLGDLEDQVAWALSHEDDCAEIARRSHDLAHRLTVQSELQKASDRIFLKLRAA